MPGVWTFFGGAVEEGESIEKAITRELKEETGVEMKPEEIARAIILNDQNILLIHRFVNGKEHYTLPGGHIEEGESEEKALIREIKEETNLKAKIDKKLWTLEHPINKSKHHFFLVSKFSGKLKLGGPEAIKNCKDDQFILEWHEIKEIPKLNIVPEVLKKKIIEELR